MEFQVPQFIDVEDKIFGPFSFKQFIYLLGGGALSFVLYKLLPIYFAILLILPVLALAGALTFYKINGKPFIFIMQAWIGYIFENKLYIWKKAPPKAKEKKADEKVEDIVGSFDYIPKLSNSKLKEISWSLDVLDAGKGKQ